MWNKEITTIEEENASQDGISMGRNLRMLIVHKNHYIYGLERQNRKSVLHNIINLSKWQEFKTITGL
jgi:hypothetical protein